MAILFYRTGDPYGCFSNFSPHPLELDGKTWPTSEHYFQAQKFQNEAYREKIRTTPSPMIAARLGRSRKEPIRPDWESVKLEIMTRALETKVAQHDDVRRALLDTGTEAIVEHTANDRFWADGGDGTGQNWLGRLLMKIRAGLTPGR